MRLLFKMEKTDEMERNIENVRKQLMDALEKAVDKVVIDPVMEVSSIEVPVDTGTLKSSTFKATEEIDVNTVSKRFGYGGSGDQINPVSGLPASAYMVEVHENLMMQHPHGKSKFLEDPVKQRTATMETEIGKEMQESVTL